MQNVRAFVKAPLNFSTELGGMELQKLLELPLRNKCGQLALYILKTNWSPTLIRAKTGPLFSLGLLWPSVTLMFSTIFVPRCLFPLIFTHPSDINPISFLLPPTPLPLLYHCPVGRSDKNTINEREKKQEASRQVAGQHGTLRQLARLYLKTNVALD